MIISPGTTVGFERESGERDRATSLPCFQMFCSKFIVLRPTALSSAAFHDLTKPHIGPSVTTPDEKK
jgi:hypothetical protein